MTTTAKLGSVSSGTTRPEDLIPTFLSLLDDLKEERSLSEDGPKYKDDHGRLDDLMGEIERRSQADGYLESEEAADDLDVLFTELEAFSPPFCYFGAHEGDGSDYGFWPDFEGIDDDTRSWPAQDGEVIRVNDTADAPSYVLHTNDHGNATLYRVELVEEWGAV